MIWIDLIWLFHAIPIRGHQETTSANVSIQNRQPLVAHLVKVLCVVSVMVSMDQGPLLPSSVYTWKRIDRFKVVDMRGGNKNDILGCHVGFGCCMLYHVVSFDLFDCCMLGFGCCTFVFLTFYIHCAKTCS